MEEALYLYVAKDATFRLRQDVIAVTMGCSSRLSDTTSFGDMAHDASPSAMLGDPNRLRKTARTGASQGFYFNDKLSMNAYPALAISLLNANSRVAASM